ncbi:MAG: T9SS type A sorting domain-containing protein [Prevotellaceae bacterium]|nr:T9SS type A sorting domain-containing protein [Prevotellaceae bacterium]
MRKTVILASLLLATVSLAARADDGYSYLTAVYNGAEESYELATVQKITFEEGYVVITTSRGEARLPQSEMEKMYFSSVATTVDQLPVQSQSLRMEGGLLRASGEGLLHIYNTAGQLVQMASVEGEMNISLATLPKGVYVANMGDETIKIVKK